MEVKYVYLFIQNSSTKWIALNADQFSFSNISIVPKYAQVRQGGNISFRFQIKVRDNLNFTDLQCQNLLRLLRLFAAINLPPYSWI